MLSARQISWLNRMDWVLATASLGYGVYQMTWFWIGFGLIAFPLAWWNPTAKFHQYVLSQITRKVQAQTWRKSTSLGSVAGATSLEPARPLRTGALPHYSWKVPPLDYKPWVSK